MSGSKATPTRTRGYKKKERTRRQLVDAAIEEIAQTGEAFTILDVTKRADVSNGTFYNYFDDRDALVDAVITEVVTAFTDTSAELVTLDDPVRRFAAITALLLERSAANPQLAKVLLRLHSVAYIDTSTGDPFRHLRNDLAAASEQGRLAREPTEAAIDLVTGTLSRAVLRLTTGTAPNGYRRDVISLLLTSFGLDQLEAEGIADEAVAGAPELDLAYRSTDSP
ncbi:MAG: TetR/AcrR family transcriptional regulator [Actinomycetota bacterium]